jgi:hypothetical protein
MVFISVLQRLDFRGLQKPLGKNKKRPQVERLMSVDPDGR